MDKKLQLALCPTPIKDDILRQVVGYNLKVLRENAGIPRKELAKYLGKALNTIDALENGRIFPKIPTLIELAIRYEKSIDEILGVRFDFETKVKEKNHLERAIARLSQFGRVERENVSYRFTISKLEGSNGELHEVNKSIRFPTNIMLVRFVEVLIEASLSSDKTFEQLLKEKVNELYEQI